MVVRITNGDERSSSLARQFVRETSTQLSSRGAGMMSTRHRASTLAALVAATVVSAALAVVTTESARNGELTAALTHKAAQIAQASHTLALRLERSSRSTPLTMTCPFALLLLVAARRRRATLTHPRSALWTATRERYCANNADRS